MNQNEPNAASQPQAQVTTQAVAVERSAIFGPGSARITVAMLVALPVLIWAASVVTALVAGSGAEHPGG